MIDACIFEKEGIFRGWDGGEMFHLGLEGLKVVRFGKEGARERFLDLEVVYFYDF